VVADRLLGHAQLAGDDRVTGAAGQQGQHVTLAGCEVRQWRRSGRGPAYVRCDSAGDGGAVERLSVGDRLLTVGALENVAARPGAQRRDHHLVVGVHGKDQDADPPGWPR
jgi:hypothetical protein